MIVISVVVVLVAVVGGLRPHRVTGSARSEPVPGPPAPGYCVLGPIPLPVPVAGSAIAASGRVVPMYRAQQLGPCTGTRYGEVVSLIKTPEPILVRTGARHLHLDDPNKDSCALTAMEYVDTPLQPVQRFWQVFPRIDSALSGPSLRQQAAGQRWAACIVTLQPAATSIAQTPSPPPYGSSIGHELHTGRERDQLGRCKAASDWTGITMGGCGQPHAVELMAYGNSGDHPVSRAQLQLSCRQLIGHLTGMSDPTAAGALEIWTHVDENNAATTAPHVPAHSNLQCAIATTGTRKLRGSLLALGEQPIPWAK